KKRCAERSDGAASRDGRRRLETGILDQRGYPGGTVRTQLLSLAAIALSAMPAFAISDNDLRAALEQRFKGDRTGACVAAAVIDNDATASAYVCADTAKPRPYDEHTAFEIG